VSPVFLFPNDTGGRIRSTNILRGLHEGQFDITLIGPASAQQRADWCGEIEQLCDRFVSWTPTPARARWRRSLDLLDGLPVNVVADRTAPAIETVARCLDEERFDVTVFDFVHAAVLRPPRLAATTVCFTHNVEAEIFARHAEQSDSLLMRRIWATQHAKMARFERQSLQTFDAVVAVSTRDAQLMRERYGLKHVEAIPTGVDLDKFAWRPQQEIDAAHPPTIVFTGSMDWDANIDGVHHFVTEALPLIRARIPDVRFVVVGRHPPPSLLALARSHPEVTFTGYVDDVRPYVHAAHVFVIPLRVGGGTRIKAFEAMAMGCPVVSTSVGVEGLDVTPDTHCLVRESASEQADAVVGLLREPLQRERLSRQARDCVEQRFGHRVAAEVFERICLNALKRRQPAH
jgi:glycosyltransferase involved in cell wall biosynthesis